jgi:serine/threonine-protein kinase
MLLVWVMSEFLAIDSVVTGTLSDYRILGMVGRGGMGAVYRVMRLADHTVWALKEMRPTEEMRPVEDADQRRLFYKKLNYSGRCRIRSPRSV